MINLDVKALIILSLMIITAFYSCEDSSLSPEEILEGIEISPNPFNDSILIEINGKAKGDINYQILNPTGRIIKSDEFTINSKRKYTKIIDLKELEAGIYYLKIEYEDSSIAKRIFKQDNTGA